MPSNNNIRFNIDFDIKKQKLNELKTSLQELQKFSFKKIAEINNTDIDNARRIFKQIQGSASKVEQALDKAFNHKLGTINLEEFKNELNGLNFNKIHQGFAKAGAAGQTAFRNLTNDILKVNTGMKESHTLLNKMADTMANTIKWNIASAAMNSVTQSVQQAWGYVKSLDRSLNDIRVVTGKTSEQMGNFAIKANEAAKALGRTTTDYTEAALIFAQQGLSDKEIEKRAEIVLKTANITGQSTDAVSEQLTSVWNGYKVSAAEAEVYVDRLAAVAATTASNLSELSGAMSKVASAAASMGVGEEQLAAQLSTIISVTRQAPQTVGTALTTQGIKVA